MNQVKPEISEEVAVSFFSRELKENLGTFQDNLRAPIHNWFKYPAGYSYKLVAALLEEKKFDEKHWVLDPFVGCGTTSVVAKEYGVNSVGIELHPFVWWVAKTKCFWEYDMHRLYRMIQDVKHLLYEGGYPQEIPRFPALVYKCFSEENLKKLAFIRTTIEQLDCTEAERDFFLLALVGTLRTASKAGTGWPYIAPTKFHEKTEQDGIEVFCRQVDTMFWDLTVVLENRRKNPCECELLLIDAREPYPLEDASIDFAVTSPPYLNNYDYADRTRLELYFLGWAESWHDITEKIRDKLMISATTQIRREDFRLDDIFSELSCLDPAVHKELFDKVKQLEEIRTRKGGKKSYDLMVAGYFRDMLRVLKQVYRVLKPDAEFVLVLGDSAPYGVYIPTEEYLGKLGLAVGFKDYRVFKIRERGGKWKHNSQRHKVMLKESLLVLKK